MSYDFRLFKSKLGEDLLVTAQTETDTLSTSPLDPQKEALKHRVADALRAANPELEIFEFQYNEIAKFMKISLEEARLKFRHLELNGPLESNSGIQIILFDDEASLTVPYWHTGARASETFRRIWVYLELINREAGYLVYDPQIDRVFDPSSGFEDALNHYMKVASSIDQIPRKA